jgi:hypothetical protein
MTIPCHCTKFEDGYNCCTIRLSNRKIRPNSRLSSRRALPPSTFIIQAYITASYGISTSINLSVPSGLQADLRWKFQTKFKKLAFPSPRCIVVYCLISDLDHEKHFQQVTNERINMFSSVRFESPRFQAFLYLLYSAFKLPFKVARRFPHFLVLLCAPLLVRRYSYRLAQLRCCLLSSMQLLLSPLRFSLYMLASEDDHPQTLSCSSLECIRRVSVLHHKLADLPELQPSDALQPGSRIVLTLKHKTKMFGRDGEDEVSKVVPL